MAERGRCCGDHLRRASRRHGRERDTRFVGDVADAVDGDADVRARRLVYRSTSW